MTGNVDQKTLKMLCIFFRSNEDSKAISGAQIAQIAGVVAACVVLVLVIIAGIIFYQRKKSQEHQEVPQEDLEMDTLRDTHQTAHDLTVNFVID